MKIDMLKIDLKPYEFEGIYRAIGEVRGNPQLQKSTGLSELDCKELRRKLYIAIN